jgi:A/G-specific adenine glycosylase
VGGRLTAVQDAVLAWADEHRRDLPWRATRDPWAILVSEVMLQQTQVARVAERWPLFVARYPTVRAMAAVALGDVLREWQGLGYPRRARNLWNAAATIVEVHGGSVPSELDALLALPGVGPYTARAVRAFAFELDAAVVDTNVARVVARAVAGRSLTAREVQALADDLLPTGRAWAWNQALLDLGAGPCRRRTPVCGECPVKTLCAWQRSIPGVLRANPADAMRGSEPSDGGVEEEGSALGWANATGGMPDPADGTAGASTRQGRFVGSDRQGRGAILRALAQGPIAVAEAALITGWSDPLRIERIIADLAGEGLIHLKAGLLRFP